MANETMTLISTVNVGSGGAANIAFTSIPQSYTDLVLVWSGRDTAADLVWGVNFLFNLDATTSNYSNRNLYGSGSATASETRSDYVLARMNVGANSTANTFSNVQMYIPNYAGSTSKSFSVDVVTENNATSAYQTIIAGRWSPTTAISQIHIVASGAFAQYSSASLYGILKGSGGASVS